MDYLHSLEISVMWLFIFRMMLWDKCKETNLAGFHIVTSEIFELDTAGLNTELT